MISIIPTAEIDKYWPEVAPLLEPAVKQGGRATLETVKEWLRAGSYQLWLAHDERITAAATTSISEYPAVTMLTIVHLGGHDLCQWLHDGIGAIASWAEDHDCDGVEIIGREEWARVLPGFERRAVMAERWLQ